VARAEEAGTDAQAFAFDPAGLEELAPRAPEYQTALPFPHIVIDDFLPETVVTAVLDEFPGPNDIAWDVYHDRGNTEKLATQTRLLMGPVTRNLVAELNSSVFVDFLETLTGIAGLIPDPHLIGGGLHEIEPGGYLKIHADFNRHERLRLDRRLNLLLYLNRGWAEQYGGHLELWNRDMTSCAKRILPVANRCVVFNTTDISYHGHPDPLACPEGQTRKSVALYYYSNGRPDEERSPSHTTLYQTPSEVAERRRAVRRARLRRYLPPVAIDLAKRVEGRLKGAGR